MHELSSNLIVVCLLDKAPKLGIRCFTLKMKCAKMAQKRELMLFDNDLTLKE